MSEKLDNKVLQLQKVSKSVKGALVSVGLATANVGFAAVGAEHRMDVDGIRSERTLNRRKGVQYPKQRKDVRATPIGEIKLVR